MASSSSESQNQGNGQPTRHERALCCFKEWMQTQHQDLSELLHHLHQNSNHEGTDLIQKCVSHFEDYITKRHRLAEEGVSLYFAPTWCTSLENAMFWIAGCRPSIFIRLLYALSGAKLESLLSSGLIERAGELRVGGLGPDQLEKVNELHVKTIQEETKLTSEMVSFQEEVADQPIAVIANQMERVGEVNEDANKALGDLEKRMKEVMKMADDLRMKTMKEILGILNPTQGVEFLAASKKLHLTLHEWGKSRDQKAAD